MSDINYWLILLAFLAEILGTVSGVGSSLIFIPVASLFFEAHQVLFLTATLHILGNAFRLIYFRQPQLISYIKKYVLPYTIATGLGALITAYSTSETIHLGLGILLIVFSIKNIARIQILRMSERKIRYLMVASGFITGWLGSGGAIRAVALSNLNLTSLQYTFISSGIDIGGDLLRLGIYTLNGFYKAELLIYIPAFILSSIVGGAISKWILKRIPDFWFFRFINFVVLGIGIFTLFSALL